MYIYTFICMYVHMHIHTYIYRIAGNFRGRKISRIVYNKLFREINFEVSWLALEPHPFIKTTPLFTNSRMAEATFTVDAHGSWIPRIPGLMGCCCWKTITL